MAAYKRRNYFIRKGFQGRFIFRFLMASSIGIVLSIGLFQLLALRKIDAILFSMSVPSTAAGQLLFGEALTANVVAIVFVALVLVATARGMLRKISEPLAMIGAGFRKLGNGDLRARISLRQGDEFRDFGEKINAMARELNERFSRIKHDHVHRLAESVRELGRAADEEEFRILNERILQDIKALEEQIGAFRK